MPDTDEEKYVFERLKEEARRLVEKAGRVLEPYDERRNEFLIGVAFDSLERAKRELETATTKWDLNFVIYIAQESLVRLMSGVREQKFIFTEKKPAELSPFNISTRLQALTDRIEKEYENLPMGDRPDEQNFLFARLREEGISLIERVTRQLEKRGDPSLKDSLESLEETRKRLETAGGGWEVYGVLGTVFSIFKSIKEKTSGHEYYSGTWEDIAKSTPFHSFKTARALEERFEKEYKEQLRRDANREFLERIAEKQLEEQRREAKKQEISRRIGEQRKTTGPAEGLREMERRARESIQRQGLELARLGKELTPEKIPQVPETLPIPQEPKAKGRLSDFFRRFLPHRPSPRIPPSVERRPIEEPPSEELPRPRTLSHELEEKARRTLSIEERWKQEFGEVKQSIPASEESAEEKLVVPKGQLSFEDYLKERQKNKSLMIIPSPKPPIERESKEKRWEILRNINVSPRTPPSIPSKPETFLLPPPRIQRDAEYIRGLRNQLIEIAVKYADNNLDNPNSGREFWNYIQQNAYVLREAGATDDEINQIAQYTLGIHLKERVSLKELQRLRTAVRDTLSRISAQIAAADINTAIRLGQQAQSFLSSVESKLDEITNYILK